MCVCVCVHSVECLYQSTSHLEVHCQPGVLIPGQKREVDFLFYPREARYYHEVIPFEINGLSTMQVEIHGEGTDMKVGLPVFLLVFCLGLRDKDLFCLVCRCSQHQFLVLNTKTTWKE